ncbi:MAG: carbohydrate kinase family protein [Candidatus Woesearchaeota archaeon]
MYDVITVGSATVDVFVDTDSELIKIRSKHRSEELLAYPLGSKILIKNIEFMIGGGGTNTAVAFAKLGHKVGYLGKIGRDDGGRRVRELLRTHRVDFLGSLSSEMTGYSIILDSIEHDRTILTYKGAIDGYSFGEIKLSRLKTEWFYFSSLVDDSYKVLEKLAEYALKHRIKVAFNPSSYLAAKGSRYLGKVLKCTTVLVLNKEEAELVVGKGCVKDLLAKLRELGPRIVIVTCGKEGLYAYDGSEFLYVQAHKLKVVEATGAGDSFAAGFVSGLLRKNDLRFALKLGLINAESVIQCRGAKGGLLSYRKAMRILKSMPVKVKKI